MILREEAEGTSMEADTGTEPSGELAAKDDALLALPVNAVALSWCGDGSVYVPWAPAADLTADKIDRLTYRRTGGLRRGDKGFDRARAGVVADLLATGLYKEA